MVTPDATRLQAFLDEVALLAKKHSVFLHGFAYSGAGSEPFAVLRVPGCDPDCEAKPGDCVGAQLQATGGLALQLATFSRIHPNVPLDRESAKRIKAPRRATKPKKGGNVIPLRPAS